MRSWTIGTLVLCLSACATEGEAITAEPVLQPGTCEDLGAGAGWRNQFLSQNTDYAYYRFQMFAQSPDGGPIDAVIGMADGPASSFLELGPIIRFNPNGFIDARNGDHYEEMTSMPYQNHPTIYTVGMRVDVRARTYDAWISYQVGTAETQYHELAANFAFRSELANVNRLDTIARFVDSQAGSVYVCDFVEEPYGTGMTSEPGLGWSSLTYPAQSGVFHADFDAWGGFPVTDGVIGLAAAAPSTFGDLAAILRFRPDGAFDARDGDTYRADNQQYWATVGMWHVSFDVDVPTKRYSVSVWDGQHAPVRIATNYRFRTEQANASSLGYLGQFVDGDEGFLGSQYLKISY